MRCEAGAGSRVLAAALLAGALLVPVLAAPVLAKKPKASGPPGRIERQTLARAGSFLGTTCTILADGFDTTHVRRTLDEAFEVTNRFERAIDLGNGSSELSQLNRAPAQTRVEVPADLYPALQSALALAQETNGAFDPTLEPVARAWQQRGAGRPPTTEQLNDALSRVGWRRARLEPGTRTVWFQREGMALDLDDIGRGVALDSVEAVLRAARVERAFANFGSAVLAMSDREGWSVKIAHPDGTRPAASLAVRSCAVSTASQGERGSEANGRRYGGVLDPARGVPVDRVASVTVVTRSAARAAALSIALLVMGREEAQRWAEDHRDVGVLWLEPEGDAVRAWKWNLPPVTAARGVTLDWMN